MKLGENSKKLWKRTHLRLVFPQHFLFSQTSTCVSITQYKHSTCFLFLNYRAWLQSLCQCQSLNCCSCFVVLRRLKPVQEKKSLENEGHLSQFFDLQGKNTIVRAILGTRNAQKLFRNRKSSLLIFESLKILALPGENIMPHMACKNVADITESLGEFSSLGKPSPTHAG